MGLEKAEEELTLVGLEEAEEELTLVELEEADEELTLAGFEEVEEEAVVGLAHVFHAKEPRDTTVEQKSISAEKTPKANRATAAAVVLKAAYLPVVLNVALTSFSEEEIGKM